MREPVTRFKSAFCSLLRRSPTDKPRAPNLLTGLPITRTNTILGHLPLLRALLALWLINRCQC